MTSVVLTSSAANAVIAAAVPQSFQLGFATPVVVAPVGGPVTFVNTDTIPHNLQADGIFLSKKKAKKTDWCNLFPSKECPIFYSDAVGQGADRRRTGPREHEVRSAVRVHVPPAPEHEGHALRPVGGNVMDRSETPPKQTTLPRDGGCDRSDARSASFPGNRLGENLYGEGLRQRHQHPALHLPDHQLT